MVAGWRKRESSNQVEVRNMNSREETVSPRAKIRKRSQPIRGLEHRKRERGKTSVLLRGV